jgi:hypothetical protein
VSAYSYIAADLASPGTPIAELPLTGVSWGRMLNGAADFSGKLKLPPPTSPDVKLLLTLWREATDRATKCIYVVRDGVPLGCYIIWTQGYSSADQSISVKGAELFSYARRRPIEAASGDLTVPVEFTNKRPVDIATALFVAAGNIDITYDLGGGTGGTTISKIYRGTDNRGLADEILELAAIDDGGFDFRTDVRLTSTGDFERVWIAREFLGGTTEIVAKYETNVATLGVTRRGDLRANDAIVLGPTKAGDSTTRETRRRSTTEWAPLMTVVEAHSNEDEPGSVLAERAAALLAASKDQELLEVSVVASAIDAQIGTFHPGDVMRLVVNPDADPFFHEGLDVSLRLLRYTVDVPDEGPGTEVVKLTLAES